MIAKAFLAVIVTELVGSFNVGKTMDAIQVAFAVNGIQADYYFLKIDELKYCFENAKKGRYGTMYDRIDAAVIFGWIEKYLEERTQICYEQNVEQNKIYNSEVMHHTVAEKLKEAIKKNEKENPVNIELVSPRQRERTKEEILIQEIFAEFDTAWLKIPAKPPGEEDAIRTIKYKGAQVSQEEYLQIKLEENEKLKKDIIL